MTDTHATASQGDNPYDAAHLPRLRLTTGRWRNRRRTTKDGREKLSKVLAHRGHGIYAQFAEGRDYEAGTRPSRGDGPTQKCILGVHGVVPLDVDDEADYLTTRTARFITRADAISVRPTGAGLRFHALIDFRAVPPELRPNGSSIRGADVKVNGFIPVPGCEHGTGDLYRPVIHPGNRTRIIRGTTELAAAMRADQAEYEPVSRQHGGGGYLGDNSPLPPTGELLQHGVPHPHDTNLTRLAGRLARQGKTEEQAYAIWRRVADLTQDPDDPFEYEEDFLDQWASGLEKYGSDPPPAGDLAWAQSQVPAGQGICPPIDSPSTLDKPADLHVPYELEPPKPVRTLAQLRAKVKAETKHRNPLSRDNDKAPAGWQQAYSRMADVASANALNWSLGPPACEWDAWARIAGLVSKEAKRPPGGFCFRPEQVRGLEAHIAWSLHGDGVPLLEQMGNGWLRFLDDTKTAYHRWACGCGYKTHSAENYPNVDEGTCPVAKGDSALDLDGLVKMIRAATWGAELTHYQVAAVINHPEFRRQFGLGSCRYASKSGVAKATSRAIAAGEMTRDRDPVLFRRGRHWLLAEPAHYVTAGIYSQDLLDRVSGLIGHILPEVVKRLGRCRPSAPMPMAA